MKFIIALILVLVPACVPRLVTTNSPIINDLKKGIEQSQKNDIELSKVLDKVTDKIGLNVPSLTNEFKDALKQQQEVFDKKYEILSAQNAEILKKLASIALGYVGVPPAVTNAGFTAVDALMGAGGIGAVAKIGMDMYATRRREKEHQAELEEAEEEKEKIRLRLEKEKEELRVKALIKQKTMAKVKPEYQIEYDRCREEAERELKARGEI